MPPAAAAFRDLLVGLDTEALRAFAAAVYEARGWAVEHAGDDLLVRGPGETDWTRLAVRHPADGAVTDAAADRVVVPTLAADTDAAREGSVIDAADLLELVSYALDEAARMRLFREFLDCDPDDIEAATERGGSEARPAVTRPAESVTGTSTTGTDPTSVPAADETGTSGDTPVAADATVESHPDGDGNGDRDGDLLGPWPRSRRFAVVAATLLVIGTVAVAVGPTLAPSDGVPGDSGAGIPNGTASPDTQLADSEFDPVAIDSDGQPIASDDGGAARTGGPLPPGVDADGIGNASTLVAAHEAALAGRSYRLSVVAREFVGGRPTAVARERTLVESPTRYRSDVRVIGTFRRQPRAIGRVSAYANGTTRYVRLTDGTDADGTIRFTERGAENGTAGGPARQRVPLDSTADPFAKRTATYLQSVLNAENATIVGSFERDGLTYVWIDLQRRPPRETDTVDSVLIDERGLVHEIRREYASPLTVRTVITVRITPTNATASPPPWL